MLLNKHTKRTTYLHFIKVRTKLLSQIRFFLNLGAFILLAILLLWPYLENKSDRDTLSLTSDPQHNAIESFKSEKNNTNQVLAPHFTGWDKKGQFFSIKARSTKENKANTNNTQSNTYDLLDLEASIKLLSGEIIYIKAKSGLLNSEDQILLLNQDVFINHSQGYKINTSQAIVYYGQSLIVGDHPINGIGPQGLLKANGFRIEDNGAKIILEGQTFVEINTKK